MTEVVDPSSMIGAAQDAVAAGDFPAAERLLREAAALQESTLGDEHEDLASTLNNLAFVCERTNHLADAERYYRRAHAIAVASLGPRHPFVATSIKNLVEFCAAHDIPIWKPPAAASNVESTHSLQPVHIASWRAPRAIAAAVLCVTAIVVGAFTMRSRETPTSSVTVPAPTPTIAVPTREPSPAVAVEAAPDAAPVRVDRPEPRATVERPAPRGANVTPQPVNVLNARLCSVLVKRGSPDWQCASANVRLRQGSGETGLQPGTYFFYTRLLTTASTTVEHRWYRDGRLHQVMRLRVTANPSGGYRTYSSNTISQERVGDWKVELRAANGTLLHEERFVIR